MESKRESAMCAYEGFSVRESETLTDSYNRLNMYVNDLWIGNGKEQVRNQREIPEESQS